MKPVVESVILHRNKFSRESAKRWIHEHGYKGNNPDTTDAYYRFRQHNPESLKAMGYYARSVPLGDDGYLIIFYPPS